MIVLFKREGGVWRGWGGCWCSGLLFWDRHPIQGSSVDLVPHGMEVCDRTEKYCRCLLFVCDQTAAPRRNGISISQTAFYCLRWDCLYRPRFPARVSDNNYRCLALLSGMNATFENNDCVRISTHCCYPCRLLYLHTLSLAQTFIKKI